MPHSGKLINHCVKRSGAAALVHQMAQTNLEWTLMSDCGLAASIWTTASHNFVSNKLDCHLRQWWARMLLGIAWDAAEGAAMQPWFDLIWFDNLTGLTRFDLIWFDLIWFGVQLTECSDYWLIHPFKNVLIAGETLLRNWPWSWPLEDDLGELQTRKALPLLLFCDGWGVLDILGICTIIGMNGSVLVDCSGCTSRCRTGTWLVWRSAFSTQLGFHVNRALFANWMRQSFILRWNNLN